MIGPAIAVEAPSVGVVAGENVFQRQVAVSLDLRAALDR